MTETEPEWDDDSRNWVSALADMEADTCNGCGGRLSETLHEDGIPNKWIASFTVCDRCVAIEKAQVTQEDKDEKVKSTNGHVFNNARHWMAMTLTQARKRNQAQRQQARRHNHTEAD